LNEGPEGEYARLLAEGERYAEQFDRGDLSAPPLAGVAIHV
jgi:hypothetical protein